MVAETAFGPIVFAAVCDGVGGFEQGEFASSVVIKRFERWFGADAPRFFAANRKSGHFELSGLKSVWLHVLEELNQEIFNYGEENGISLGTTFSGIVACRNSFFIGHVGDCRIYRTDANSTVQLTSDHTWVAQQVRAGALSEDEAFSHPKANVILQAIGSQEDLCPDFLTGNVGEGDLFTLCCDGLYKDISGELLLSELGQLLYLDREGMKEECKHLVHLSMDHGSQDNVTILCFSLDDAPKSAWLPEVRPDALASGTRGGRGDDRSTVISKDSRTVLVASPGPRGSGDDAR